MTILTPWTAMNTSRDGDLRFFLENLGVSCDDKEGSSTNSDVQAILGRSMSAARGRLQLLSRLKGD